MRLGRVVIIAFSVLMVAFAIYLKVLYDQLDRAFIEQAQFIPTRIYSDVTRITPAQTRAQIEDRLTRLAYKTETPEKEQIQFTLHSIDYPLYLIPESHPILEAPEPTILLKFDGDGESSLLQAIEISGREVPDVYLEPELVTTLSRSGSEKNEIRAPIPFSKVPAPVWKAIIAIEDQHFLDHKGLDPRGIARAFWVNLKTMSLAQGGSILTAQLVKNLMARRNKNIFKKANELLLALILEARFEKEQILERYLNEVYLGQVGNFQVHGVSEGAEHFFGKQLDDLNLGEVALMAGLIRGPAYYSPYTHLDRAIERQKLVLKKMMETGHIAEDEMKAALAEPIRLAPPITIMNKAPFFSDFVKAELIREFKDKMSDQELIAAGFRVYTTIDMHLNSLAQRTVAKGIEDIEKRLKLDPVTQRIEGALASVDQSTGAIRTLVGGRSYAQSNFNRILNMRRQVGSTFKPLVYLAAFETGVDPQGIAYGPAHPAEDAPWKLIYDGKKQTWNPKNYDKEFKGWISYRTALALSVNTVTAKLGVEIGIPRIIETARALGIESELPNVPSLSLGVAELSPIELLKAYAAIANHGEQDQLTVIRGITQTDGTGYMRFVYHPKQVVSAGAADLLTSMLQSIFLEGTARSALDLGFERPAAGKTGTTSHHRDSWFVGYTPQLTTVVWVGMDQNTAQASRDPKAPKTKPVSLTGAGSALPIWLGFMKEALSSEAPTPFEESPHLVDVLIDRHSGKRADDDCPAGQIVVEKYIKDREPKEEACEAAWPASVKETSL